MLNDHGETSRQLAVDGSAGGVGILCPQPSVRRESDMRDQPHDSSLAPPSSSESVSGWALRFDQGLVSAQAPAKPFMMQRVYTGTDGLSHVENIELNAQSVLEDHRGTGQRVAARKLQRLSRRSGTPVSSISRMAGSCRWLRARGQSARRVDRIHRRSDRQRPHDGKRRQGSPPVNPVSVRGPEAGHRTDWQGEVTFRH